ncbi:MmgE/PrpD family protein [Rhodobacter sp. 24-YEA-8]|uniref:MmgE/PrpD family protein n=1 Tax=Rhodobacter sp. 24-YEA-8 TaxID=1884310 RepID=UPI0008979825|nr:MmgE/PrpD family protein [Rhodobacter sp. 24-YEA-8]SED15276.1 2-methylcitrate dehydratase PrpD [Rhodobacter sp. 24-YEA-8]
MSLSRRIAAFATDPGPLPVTVRVAGRRAFLNMTGCAIGGAREGAIDRLAALLPAFSGPATASLIGREERADMLWAAYINAAAANIFDYDDTHIPTVIHPAAPVGPAVLALAETLAGQGRPVSGKALIRAFVTGMEVTCRLGLALHPVHYARGWHITSTCGTFGAALAAGQILGLTGAQMVDAMGHALAQNAGSVETLGTMSKSLSVGQAARAGLMGALLAQREFTGPEAPLEGRRGFLALHSDAPDLTAFEDLGKRWEVLHNTFKPYPCGVVLNPVIEACLALHHELKAAQITRVTLTGHPLLRQRTDRPGVTSGRLAQVSAQHAVAVSLIRGEAGLSAFSDAAAADPVLRAFGAKLTFCDDPGFSLETAEVRLDLADGSSLTRRVDAAKGGLEYPLSDEDLAAKLAGQIRHNGAVPDAGALVAALTGIEETDNAAAFLAMTRPPKGA